MSADKLAYVRAVLLAFLVTAFLIFILLFFAPLLMGITISEAVAIKAIESYTAIVITTAGSLGTVMLCVLILLAIGVCFWGLFRFVKLQDTPQVFDAPKALTLQERRYLIGPIDKGRHKSVLKTHSGG